MMMEVAGKPRENVSYPQTHSHTITFDTGDRGRSDENQMYSPLRYFYIQNYISRVTIFLLVVLRLNLDFCVLNMQMCGSIFCLRDRAKLLNFSYVSKIYSLT